MENIENILDQEQVTFDELFICLEEIERLGDVFILKIDGEREDTINTIMISFPDSSNEMIRYDDSDIKQAIRNALTDYFLVRKSK